MNDPLEIFESTYRAWRPPGKPEPRWSLVLWPAVAGAATIAALVFSQASPVRANQDQPSAILIEQMTKLEAADPRG